MAAVSLFAKATFRGYEYTTFADAFARYLPSEAEQAEQANKYRPELVKSDVEHVDAVPHSELAISPDKHCLVPLVPLATQDPTDVQEPELDARPPFGITPSGWAALRKGA